MTRRRGRPAASGRMCVVSVAVAVLLAGCGGHAPQAEPGRAPHVVMLPAVGNPYDESAHPTMVGDLNGDGRKDVALSSDDRVTGCWAAPASPPACARGR